MYTKYILVASEIKTKNQASLTMELKLNNIKKVTYLVCVLNVTIFWRLKDILKDFNDFIYKKKTYEVMIFDLKKYTNSENLFITLYIVVR